MLTLLLICLHCSTWRKSLEAAISRYPNQELTDGCLLQGESFFFFNVHHRNFTIWKIKLHLRKCFLVLESQVFSLTKTTTFVWILWECFQFMAGACKSRTKCTSKAKLISAHTFISYLLSPPLYSVVAFLGTWHFHFFPLSVRICLYTYMSVHMHVDMYK